MIMGRKGIRLCFTSIIIIGAMVIFGQLNGMPRMTLVNNLQLSLLEYKARVNVEPTTTPRKRGPSKVLILTYMRSGSSLTGDILQQSPGAFYVYEPIHNIRWHDKTENWTYPDAPTKLVTPETIHKERVDVLYRLLTCDLMNVPDRVLEDGFLGRGFLTKELQPCVKAAKQNHNKTEGTRACIQDLQNACQASPLRVLKTIRFSMEQARNLSVLIPDLKIIHLVRDPRATLKSQNYLGECNGVARQQCVERFCALVEDDIVKADLISKSDRNRIFTLKYERLAKSPIQVSKELYEFVDGSFTKQVEEYIFNITSAGRKDDCIICTTRGNSTKLVNEWKKTMNKDFVKEIQNRCNYLLKRFRYEIISL
ncbi:carbohydrate sulfotransferase 3-like isoform X2 [Mya arenaria]|uniref:carbohydrate sulfotransferase 3-like isoform X1 n=1 Tax=Mya arenaria TaxID=6604 RepID=UPI0022E4E983|nr:carbohydrate sulfotransferase 3-like isoform X1 [Mya arenaria]XP_052803421.1 carbohydrate sulfotransferase 3-like isoform X1 [Mya arenaria]XP_052803422.1 carbohydrate sulfotransferase 3-like isoform X1 [Mya arenaria]XP_052803423.1 carbohydrate sulfotransferase 3-like isoform X1 [Mya arenaria]XP_052803425.1 carbohydrate sulfotransferase 3-like isoform X1 [Mya arenaria]XP_052803426.1 carbohydrate sulfotransferase 3-like isoform X2 [Mya arenaria]XP_052803427.1 carbohydrate sulfotransferase 3-